YLAMRRGEAEEVLNLSIVIDEDSAIRRLQGKVLRNPGFLFAADLREAAEDSFRRLLFPSIEAEALLAAKERADEEAIGVFARNLRDLLLAPPAGARVVLAVDPGFR